jgi:hypothetical protein
VSVDVKEDKPEESLGEGVDVHLREVADDLATAHERVRGHEEDAKEKQVLSCPLCLSESEPVASICEKEREQSQQSSSSWPHVRLAQ